MRESKGVVHNVVVVVIWLKAININRFMTAQGE
jgi:hypothetical protein